MRTLAARGLKKERYQKIVSVFARHGFGSFLAQLQIDRSISLSPRLVWQGSNSDISPAEHLRLALEELGPTFVKMGQMLSTRPDVLPPDFINELSKLQDSVPPRPWEDVRAVLVEELGDEPELIFEEIDPLPLAAASLAQVHAATLINGAEVVVKIQRPAIQATIETDLEILRDMASLAQRTPWGELNNPIEIVEEFAFSLQNELNYRREGHNADRFRANFDEDERLHVPKIYWKYTTQRVLVLEKIEGIKIDDIEALDEAGINRKRVAIDSVDIIIKEVLEDGFFHADPHAGNYVVMDGGVIGAMDFGLVGVLNERDRKHLSQLYIDVINFDVDSLLDELERMNVARAGVDRPRLANEIERMLNKYAGMSLEDIRIQELFEEVTRLLHRHHLAFPTNLWLLGKSLAMMEGLGLQLDPDFDFFAVSEPYVEEMKRTMWLPKADWSQALLRQGSDWIEIANLLPRTGRRLLEKVDKNDGFEVRLKDTSRVLDGLSRLVNRLALSIVIAGMVVGLAILIQVTSSGSPVQRLVIAGFVATFALGFWLLISILRGAT